MIPVVTKPFISKWPFLLSLLTFSACDVSTFLPGVEDTGGGVGAEPPVITQFDISPDYIDTTTDITITAEYYDFDSPDNVLSESYHWYVNDTLLANESSSVLSSDNFSKSDSVKVVLTVSDGTNSTKKNEIINVQNAAPVISLSGSTEIAYSQNFSLQTLFDDPDNDVQADQLQYEILYGPNGMTISNTGAIAWTPKLPLFEQQSAINIGIRVTDDNLVVDVFKTVTVNDTSRLPPFSRTALSVSSNPYASYVGDLDNNGSNEILTIDADSNLFTLSFQTDHYVQSWVSSISPVTDTQVISGVQAVNTNSSNEQEIFLAASSSNLRLNSAVIKLDGKTRRVINTIDISSRRIPAFLLDDLNGDSTKELILLVEDVDYNMFHLEIRSPEDLSLIWQSPSLNLGYYLHIDNVDNDNYKEIISSNGYVYGFNGTDYVNEWASSSPFGEFVKTADLTGNGISEIIGYTSSGLSINSAVSKSQLSIFDTFNVNAISVANLDADPEPEIITTNYYTYHIYSYDNVSSTLNEDYSAGLKYTASNIIVDDLDNDNENEIGISNGYGNRSFTVLGIAQDFPIEWQNSEEFFYDGSFFGGGFYSLAADNKQLVYIANMESSYFTDPSLISLDVNNETITLSNSISLAENEHNLTAADVDADGTDEFFITGSSSLSGSVLKTYNILTDFFPWSSPDYYGQMVSSASADINNDGHPDMIALLKTLSYYDSDLIHIYDVFNSTLLWSHSLEQNETAVNIDAVDLDNDGDVELITATRAKITVFKKSGAEFISDNSASLSTNGTGIRDIEISDIENDGSIEITSLSCGYDSFSYDEICEINIYDANLNHINRFGIAGSARDITYEPFESGRKNLLVNHSNFLNSRTSVFELVDATTGDVIMRSPSLLGRASNDSVNYVDTDNDGTPEISYATNTAINVTR